MLSTTFASIVGPHLDPNSTLTLMNTQLGGQWYGPMEKDDFLLCELEFLEANQECCRVLSSMFPLTS